MFIDEFYRFVARRTVVKLRLRRFAQGALGRRVETVDNVLRVGVSLVEYVVFDPLLIFGWYLVFVVLLPFLASGPGTETLRVNAMAVVAAVRVTASNSADLARDLAKMRPLALLGVVILEGPWRGRSPTASCSCSRSPRTGAESWPTCSSSFRSSSASGSLESS